MPTLQSCDDARMTEGFVDTGKRSKQKRLRVLCLHSFRQNSHVLKRSTSALAKALRAAPVNCDLAFAQSPLLFQAETSGPTELQIEAGLTPVPAAQRTWWELSEDGHEYRHLELTYRHLENVFLERGPFDGVLGFGQGATLAALLAAQNPFGRVSFRFVVCISGYPSRADAHQELMRPASINMPSLHILGMTDGIVPNEKTLRLSSCFVNPTVLKHSGAHFTPSSWPTDQIAEWVALLRSKDDGAVRLCSIAVDSLRGVKAKTEATFKRYADHEQLEPVGLSSAGAALLGHPLLQRAMNRQKRKTIARDEVKTFIQDAFASIDATECTRDDMVDDLLTLSWCFRDPSSYRTKKCKKPSLVNEDLFYWVWTDVYLAVPEKQLNVVSALELIPQHGCWKDLNKLAVTAHDTGNDTNGHQIEQFLEGIVDLFVQRLRRDIEVYNARCTITDGILKDDQQSPSLQNVLERKRARAASIHLPSDCALYAPRFSSAADRTCRLAKRIAYGLVPYFPRISANNENEYAKQDVYICYKKLLRNICRMLRKEDLSYMEQQPQMCYARQNSGTMCTLQNVDVSTISTQEFLDTPLPENILNPHEEPVSACPLDDLVPILDWLNSNAPLNTPGRYFTRGYVTHDGTFDMCKQVVGPQGIRPLMEGIKTNEQITKFLLGNNVTEINGAKAVAAEMRRKGSRIETWYLAGNQWDVDGIAEIANALRDNDLIKALWLKRNPVRTAGAYHLADMLRHNTHLQVLDLAACGLLDEGVGHLMDCLESYNDTLLHLAIDGNGITPVGAARIGRYLASGRNKLITLSVEANKITDVGIPAIAAGLRVDKNLERLRIGSNMISPEGARVLFESIAHHPALVYLSLGHPKMTRMLGMQGNCLGDEGAKLVAEYLKRDSRLRVLDLVHNGITNVGVRSILEALMDGTDGSTTGLGNRSLVWLSLTSYGKHHCESTMAALTQCLERNLELMRREAGNEHFDPFDIIAPPYVMEIMSVYRTKDM